TGLGGQRPWRRQILVNPFHVDAGYSPVTHSAGDGEGITVPDFAVELREERETMSLRINDEAPNFTAETTQGTINFHEWIGDGWAILFSHSKDFTPVCTTELGYMAGLDSEFKKRNVKIIGLSVDPVSDHQRWKEDIAKAMGN